MNEYFYNSKIEEIQHQVMVLKKTIQRLSSYRFFVFFIGIGLFYLLLGLNTWMASIILIFFVLGFALLVRYQNKQAVHLSHLNKLEQIYRNEIQIKKEGSNLFGDGKEFIHNNHPYSSDLDLFGSHSIFLQINRSLSYEGKSKLVSWLTETDYSIEEIQARQDAIKELAKMESFKEEILPESVHIKKSDLDQRSILQWFRGFSFAFLQLSKFRLLFYVASLMMIILIPLSFVYSAAYIILFLFIIISLIFSFYHFRNINALHGKISKQSEVFANYSRLVEVISQQSFSSPKLKALKNELEKPDQIIHELRRLSKLIEQLDYRLNVYVAFFLNSFLFWDIRKAIQIEKWLNKNQGMLSKWLAPVAEIDALLSMSIYHFNHPSFTFPELIESKEVFISAKAIGHPLIPEDSNVLNDFDLEGNGQSDLITGSNMAGKTTFLRTIGVNAILAYTGCPVCAKNLKLSQFKVMTYMRIADSLEYNLSTFHAEIQRIKDIMAFVDDNIPCLLLLDELLRGTNSKDRARGSKALINYLIEKNATAMVSTHDLSLTNLEHELPDQIRNFHFDIVNKDDELDFDYKIKAGINQTTNAGMLLRKLGLEVD